MDDSPEDLMHFNLSLTYTPKIARFWWHTIPNRYFCLSQENKNPQILLNSGILYSSAFVVPCWEFDDIYNILIINKL